MRISDWSSTCALPIYLIRSEVTYPGIHAGRPAGRNTTFSPVAEGLEGTEGPDGPSCSPQSINARRNRSNGAADAGARKSVVKGNSVSERVDRGGRRTIKNKTSHNMT